MRFAVHLLKCVSDLRHVCSLSETVVLCRITQANTPVHHRDNRNCKSCPHWAHIKQCSYWWTNDYRIRLGCEWACLQCTSQVACAACTTVQGQNSVVRFHSCSSVFPGLRIQLVFRQPRLWSTVCFYEVNEYIAVGERGVQKLHCSCNILVSFSIKETLCFVELHDRKYGY